MGYPVFYSDKEAKLILTQNESVKSQIIKLFGAESYSTSGELNRKHLSKQIFNNKNLLDQMNQIVHPAVREQFKNWAKEQNSKIVFNEAAILFETGIYKTYDYTILVKANQDVKISRVKQRDGISEKEILKRIKNQWSDEKKTKLADFIINNNDNDMLLPQITSIFEKMS
jgi:dephospho-CoA kinase